MFTKIITWFDNEAVSVNPSLTEGNWSDIDWVRVIPFIVLHLACLAVFWVGFSWFAFYFAIALYVIRMFAVTGFYHRYFSHKAFRTSRFTQFIMALAGATAVQRGPLWWASHHRHHHAYSDNHKDSHSPLQHGFIWSHLGWFLASRNFATQTHRVKELASFIELRILDRFDIVVPTLLGIAIYLLGEWMSISHPEFGTNGLQLFIWGFVISTAFLYHGTFTVNSLAHVWGKRRYATKDQSRNNFFIALLTLGEGWHNNHHHYPAAASQGFYWWEIDFTYYGLKLLAALGIIWDLKKVPVKTRESRKILN
ncbi:MAG: acyl-CoA desaturase [Betaproteobacteria bacterium HGW-Betaproteobacteria-22]|nr:MAG: acyl-CoA desaturase [Betaproteobacteria bacterium HGW-Betaproteobacteria-22]